MRSQERSAVQVQSLWRGHQVRQNQMKLQEATTLLQARQRGIYTRKMYAEYKSTLKKKESQLQVANARHQRILENQQELLLLMNTPAEDLSLLLCHRRITSARQIQRTWRKYHNRRQLQPYHPKPLPISFSLFANDRVQDNDDAFKTTAKTQDQLQMTKDNDDAFKTTTATTTTTTTTATTTMTTRDLKEAIIKSPNLHHHRMKARNQITLIAKENEEKWRIHGNIQNDPKVRRNRKKYQHLLEVRKTSMKQLKQFHLDNENRKVIDKKREQLLRNCDIQFAKLKNIQSLKKEFEGCEDYQEYCDQKFPLPGQDRYKKALEIHNALKESVKTSHPWWKVYFAGKSEDLRRITSSWEGDSSKWQGNWRLGISTTSEKTQVNKEDNVKLTHTNSEASMWWKTYCNTTRNSDGQCVPGKEAVRSPSLVALKDRMTFHDTKSYHTMMYSEWTKKIVEEADKKTKSILHDMDRINDITSSQPEINNPPCQVDEDTMKKNRAAQKIQAILRGYQSRSKLRLLRAEVLVRGGSSTRKGMCGECGEVQAVLSCSSCPENEEFCPECWVKVHSTRRRKLHRAIPLVLKQDSKETIILKQDTTNPCESMKMTENSTTFIKTTTTSNSSRNRNSPSRPPIGKNPMLSTPVGSTKTMGFHSPLRRNHSTEIKQNSVVVQGAAVHSVEDKSSRKMVNEDAVIKLQAIARGRQTRKLKLNVKKKPFQ